MKKSTRILALLLIAIFAMGILVSCGKEEKTDSTETEKVTEAETEAAEEAEETEAEDAEADAPSDETITIGVTSMTLKEAVYTYMADAATELAAEKGNVKVEWVACENDPTLQANQVDNYIAAGVDVLVIEPARSDAASDMVKKAQEAGIPVINLEAHIWNAEADLRISTDSLTVGNLQVDHYLENDGDTEGMAILLSGTNGDEIAETITQANKDRLAEKVPGLEIYQQYHEAWDRQRAMNTMENVITQYGDDVKVVFANNDTMAIGALRAAENAGVEDKIKFYGADFDADSAQMLLDGIDNFFVVDKSSIEVGKQIVEQSIKLANGEQADFSEVFEGVETLWIGVTMVTADNIREVGAEKYPELMD